MGNEQLWSLTNLSHISCQLSKSLTVQRYTTDQGLPYDGGEGRRFCMIDVGIYTNIVLAEEHRWFSTQLFYVYEIIP